MFLTWNCYWSRTFSKLLKTLGLLHYPWYFVRQESSTQPLPLCQPPLTGSMLLCVWGFLGIWTPLWSSPHFNIGWVSGDLPTQRVPTPDMAPVASFTFGSPFCANCYRRWLSLHVFSGRQNMWLRSETHRPWSERLFSVSVSPGLGQNPHQFAHSTTLVGSRRNPFVLRDAAITQCHLNDLHGCGQVRSPSGARCLPWEGLSAKKSLRKNQGGPKS